MISYYYSLLLWILHLIQNNNNYYEFYSAGLLLRMWNHPRGLPSLSPYRGVGSLSLEGRGISASTASSSTLHLHCQRTKHTRVFKDASFFDVCTFEYATITSQLWIHILCIIHAHLCMLLFSPWTGGWRAEAAKLEHPHRPQATATSLLRACIISTVTVLLVQSNGKPPIVVDSINNLSEPSPTRLHLQSRWLVGIPLFCCLPHKRCTTRLYMLSPGGSSATFGGAPRTRSMSNRTSMLRML